MLRFLFCAFVVGCLGGSACKPSHANLYGEPAFSEAGHVQVVVEIPAGTNRKMEYAVGEGRIVQDVLPDGQKRVIRFLPYVGNYGFIPSTDLSKEKGGDGDALDVLVIAESLPTGTLLPVKPVAALALRVRGEVYIKIIAVPVDASLLVLDIADFQDFVVRHSAVKQIVELWFTNYNGLGKVEVLGWRNEQQAMAEIRQQVVKKE